MPMISDMNEALVTQNSADFHGDYADKVWKLSCGTHEIQSLTNQRESNIELQLVIKIPA